MDSIEPFYGELISSLGPIGVFTVILVFLYFKYGKKHERKGTIEDRKDKNGISLLNYMQGNIEPQLKDLRKGHEELNIKIAKLPTREEHHKDTEALHNKINGHEHLCRNFSPRFKNGK